MTVQIVTVEGSFPHRLEWVMPTTDYLYDGVNLVLRCGKCRSRYSYAGFSGSGSFDLAYLTEMLTEMLAKHEREATNRIGDEICPGEPT